MTNISLTTGFIMPSRLRSLTAETGTAMCGRADATAWVGTITNATGVNGGRGHLGSLREQQDVPFALFGTGNGSGVSADRGFALIGKPLADHAEAEATPRRYGAPGECPRRIPA
ncbi:hypothetical protein DFP74_1022 [Nocardiopsis sp. Huas11]|uniref:hypothetical protein n=1 Tax=Nocardiopsis sp. Huas11 TaxID=2183912 RepID=UPI000EB3F1FD|nr:hypothetical protein [Nocardiopsis sp. Huas11]RKS05424.1 hypothetical protein DFP74_1022 [Nocardiopsis sp. Huas11]